MILAGYICGAAVYAQMTRRFGCSYAGSILMGIWVAFVVMVTLTGLEELT